MYFLHIILVKSLKESLVGVESSPPAGTNDPMVFEGAASIDQQSVQYFISRD